MIVYFGAEPPGPPLGVHLGLDGLLDLVAVGLSGEGGDQVGELVVVVVGDDLVDHIDRLASTSGAGQEEVTLHADEQGEQVVVPHRVDGGNDQVGQFPAHRHLVRGNGLHPVEPAVLGLVIAVIVDIGRLLQLG